MWWSSVWWCRDALATGLPKVINMTLPVLSSLGPGWLSHEALSALKEVVVRVQPEHQRDDLLKALESPLDSKEFKPVNPKGNQPWIFIWRIDTEAEAPVLWPPDAKRWLVGKDPDARKDWRQEEKGTTEDEAVEWHHLTDGCEFEQASGDSEGQGSLVCCSPWVPKSWIELGWKYLGLSPASLLTGACQMQFVGTLFISVYSSMLCGRASLSLICVCSKAGLSRALLHDST